MTYIIGLKRTNENNLEGQIIFKLYVATATGVLEVDKFISKKGFKYFQKFSTFYDILNDNLFNDSILNIDIVLALQLFFLFIYFS